MAVNHNEIILPVLADSMAIINALIKVIEKWKSKLDNNFIVGSVLMGLSKAFDCIPHDLIIAKLHAYGLMKIPWFSFIPILNKGSRVFE